MKRFLAIMGAVALLISLAACGSGKPAPETEAPAPETEAPVPKETQGPVVSPVEEKLVYFSNEPEYSRLYSQRIDGTDLKLVLDLYCYDIQQKDEAVYFISDSDLYVYSIPTGEHHVLTEGVLSYHVEGNHLVCQKDNPQAFRTDLWYQNLETGEEVFLDTMVLGNVQLRDSKFYYSRHDFDAGTLSLNILDLNTLQNQVAVDDLSSCNPMLAAEGGVYFGSTDADYVNHWYFLSDDGTVTEQDNAVFAKYSEIHEINEKGILATEWDNENADISRLIRQREDGTREVLFESKDPMSYFYLTNVGSDLWIINQQRSEAVGEPNEYGFYDYYAQYSSYFLLDETGKVTPLQTADRLSRMFAQGDFPIIDSSTARKPVTQGLYDMLVLNFGYEGAAPLCSTTHGAWLNIADRKADLALLAAPTQEEKDYLKQQGVEIEMKLYGGDGLVFIGNAANPVTNLTHEQIIGIYRGEITNWSQVGGPDHEITVYYRDEQSGSQRLFKNLVFKGLEIPDFYGLGFAYMDEMSTIVEIILEDPYSIGYSIMTYLDEVYAEENLKVFTVNGVEPSPATVQTGTYPYHTQGFLVIRSDEPADSPARRLFDWFGCPVSDDLLKFNGVTPLSDSVG